jgi:hypothetical protein
VHLARINVSVSVKLRTSFWKIITRKAEPKALLRKKRMSSFESPLPVNPASSPQRFRIFGRSFAAWRSNHPNHSLKIHNDIIEINGIAQDATLSDVPAGRLSTTFIVVLNGGFNGCASCFECNRGDFCPQPSHRIARKTMT